MRNFPIINMDRTVRGLSGLIVVALVLALAWRAAGWAWYFAAPTANPQIPDLRSLVSVPNVARFPWFGALAPSPGAVAPVSDIRVIGLFAGGNRPAALLVIGTQNPIAAVAGESPAPGMKLISVADDHIIVQRNGIDEKIMLTGSTAAIQSKNQRKERKPE
jgi:hypothetical protein